MGCSDRSFEGVLLACDLDGTLLSPDGTLHPDNVASLREFLAAGGHLPQCAALEHALPPTGGWGLGIDRLAMLLAGHSHLREVIAFPFTRPQE